MVSFLQAQSTATDPLAPGEAISERDGHPLTVAGSNTWTTDAWEGNDWATGAFAAPGSEPVVTVRRAVRFAAATTTPTAGDANNLTITAEDPYGNTDTNYTGTKDLGTVPIRA